MKGYIKAKLKFYKNYLKYEIFYYIDFVFWLTYVLFIAINYYIDLM